jgi:hypothetical protein
MTFRISDITLANFCFQSSFLLTSFSTIFNNYFGDIDDDTVAYLDRNLHIGQQIKEVYEQLLSTIDMNHCFRLDTVSQISQGNKGLYYSEKTPKGFSKGSDQCQMT